MSSITGLISGGGGGGTPINGISRFARLSDSIFTDDQNQVWLRSGVLITSGFSTYPDAIVNDDNNISAYSYTGKFYQPTAQDTVPLAFTFNNDGTKFYVGGNINNTIYQYSCSTPYDFSTGSYDNVSFNVSTQLGTPIDIRFNNNGTKMYVANADNGTIFQFSLGTAYNVGTASYDSKSLNGVSQESGLTSFDFNSDGTKIFTTGTSGDAVVEYSLSTPYDLSTASYTGNEFSVSAQTAAPRGVRFNSDGTRMYIGDANNVYVYKYNLGAPYVLSSAYYSSERLSGGGQDNPLYGIEIKPDESHIYLLTSGLDRIWDYLVPTSE